MKKMIAILLSVIVLAACNNQNYLDRKDVNKSIDAALDRLEKRSGDQRAQDALPELYKRVTDNAMNRIKSLSRSNALSAKEDIVLIYQDLQALNARINNNTAAFKQVSTIDYAVELQESKDVAALAFYNAAENEMAKDRKENYKKAYQYYTKANAFIPGYKDAIRKKELAYENAIVRVVINPVQDNSFFFNSGFGNFGYNYTNEYFQQTLVRELQSENYNNRFAAIFYNDWEARRENVKPDWIVNMKLSNLYIPQPTEYTTDRRETKQIAVGRDTAGRTIYETISATLRTTRVSFNATGDMDVQIYDNDERRQINRRSFNERVDWNEEYYEVIGDTRVFPNVNNRGRYNAGSMNKEMVLRELYRKIYPQVKNFISYQTSW